MNGQRCETSVRCPKCGWVKTDKVKFLNIEEDFEGRDVMTFECPQCKSEGKSVVVKGNPG